MHAFRQQALAIIKALRERHVQAGVQYKMIATCFPGNPANLCQQLTTQSRALKTRSHHEVIDIHKATVDQVFLEPVARQSDCFSAFAHGEKAITLCVLTMNLSHESVDGGEMWTQLLHHAERPRNLGLIIKVLKHGGMIHRVPRKRESHNSVSRRRLTEPKSG